jgi:hypothetical protein
MLVAWVGIVDMQRQRVLLERGWVPTAAGAAAGGIGGIEGEVPPLPRVPLGFGNAGSIQGTQHKWSQARHEPQIACVRSVG